MNMMYIVNKFKGLFVRKEDNDKFYDYIKEKSKNGPNGYYSYSNPKKDIYFQTQKFT